MANATSKLSRLVRSYSGAGAVANAARQTKDQARLIRCDLIIYERTGHISESLIRLSQADPDRLKEMEVPAGLLTKIDRVLLSRLFECDISEYQRSGKLTNRLEVALADAGYLEDLGLTPGTLSYLRSHLAHPSNR